MALGIVVVFAVVLFCSAIVYVIWKMLAKDSLHYDTRFLWMTDSDEGFREKIRYAQAKSDHQKVPLAQNFGGLSKDIEG